jgi:hypothetical protein
MIVFSIILKTIKYLYYFSGIFVGIGVIFAICQYILFKNDTKTKYNREVVFWTTESIKMFYKEILPKYEWLYRNLPNHFYLEKEITNINIKDDKIITACKAYFDSVNDFSKERSKELALTLQVFAVGLSYGNADIPMAKKVLGRKYVKIIEVILPSIITDENVELYQECINLYNSWKYEIKMEEHTKEGKSLEIISKDLVEYNNYRV